MEALVQPEPSTEQALMKKEKISTHRVSRKRVGSCTLEWGQEQEHGGLLHRGSAGPCDPREATFRCSSGSGWVAPDDTSESSSKGAKDDVVVNREVIPGFFLSGMAQE